jgi:type III pantothenate kinase
MSQHALLLDVGNTRLKWGVLRNDRIGRTGSVSHEALADARMKKLINKLPRNVDQAFASNVAGPDFGAKLAGFIGMHCNCDLRFARAEREAFGVRNAYVRPRRLGVDRWAALIGARAESKSALCVVDAGSAITIDAMDRDGQHLGGQIIPGLQLMYLSLVKNTSGINGKSIRPFDPGPGMGIFANRTERAVQAGAVNSVCGAIERSVSVMRKEGMRPKVIVTGGGAGPILAQLGDRIIHKPHLVLQGLATMLEGSK